MSKVDRWFQQAFQAHQAGRLEEAEELYLRVLQKTPKDMESLYLLGTLKSQLSKFEEAKKYLKRALELQPGHPETLNNLGLTYRGQRRSEEAVAYYRKALAVRPDFADAHSNLASTLEVMGKFDEAEFHVREALRLDPLHPNAHYTLGLVLSAKDRFEEAAQCFIRGLQLKPDFSAAYNDLGGIYKTWGRLDQALECFDKALVLNPKAYNSRNNRGAVYEEFGRFDEALAEYEAATLLNPLDQGARWNTAFLYLKQGMLEKGWEAHETRLTNGIVSVRFPYPVWQGEPLQGKNLLVYAEQGLGDEIMFASCIPDLAKTGAKCVLECDIRLVPLFSRSFPEVLVRGSARHQMEWLTTVPAIDAQIAAGSLPRLFRPTIDHFPGDPAYLRADPGRAAFWRSRLVLLGAGLKVGICWRSGVTTGERHRYYSQLSEWGEIFKTAGVHFVNLQYGECSAELAEAESMFGVTITNFSDINLKDDIDDSAALMAGLDLVISAATAVSEIAGALGVDSFRLNHYGKQWEVLGRTDIMPWHPNTRLFDQLTPGDWDTQLALVAAALQEKVRGHDNRIALVQLSAGVELAVRDTLEDVTTYVLREQQGWYEPEYEFLRLMVQDGMSIVDVGAEIGQYAVPLARNVGEGMVTAVTASSDDADLLMKSRARNHLEQQMRFTFAGPAFSLDGELDRHGFTDIGLLRLSIEYSNTSTLERANRFFNNNSPLVMFGIRAGDQFEVEVLKWFNEHGFTLYRLIPGLGTLVPLKSSTELDVFSSNLFACRADRAAELARRGILVQSVTPTQHYPGIEVHDWQAWIGRFAYAAPLLEQWHAPENRQRDWEIYWMALNLYARSRQSPDASERVAALEAACNILGTLIQERATVPRLLSLGRMLIDLGKRETVVNFLNQVGAILGSGAAVSINEPCLALNETYGAMDIRGREASWAVAMVLEQRERLRAFSGFFTGSEAAGTWREVLASGVGSAYAENALRLIEQRHRQ
jgi:tetratricopeptide (TPR) repeat protein